MKIFLTLTCIVLFSILNQVNAQNKINHIPGDFLVQLQPGTDPYRLASDFRVFENKLINLMPVREVSKPLHIWLFHYDENGIGESKLLFALKSHPVVSEAQWNHILENRDSVPNDPSFAEQWQWVNTGASGGTFDDDVDAELAWGITTGGNTADGDTIVVCVVDDGTDLTHPDLAPNHWINYGEIPDDNIDNDGNGYTDDYLGWNINTSDDNVGNGSHGVEVNGMICAAGNNGTGGTGINWHVKIMTVRRGGSNEADAIEAYTYPLIMRQLYNNSFGNDGAFVVAVNSSWGTNFGQAADAPLWCAFYDTLGRYGVLSCASTANLDINVDTDGDLPTSCPSEFMIAVTATDNNDQRNFSAYGPVSVDVAAPGDNIYTTAAGGGYVSTSGTSFAAPLTAGIVALLYAAPCSELINLAKNDPQAAATMVRNYILQGVDPVESLDGFIATGGRVNAFNSLQIIMNNCGPCPPPHALTANNTGGQSMTISWINPENTQDNQLRWRITGTGTWNIINNVSAPFNLTGLSPCTSYDLQVVAACSGNLVTESNIIAHETDGCCVAPDLFITTMISQDFVSCAWSYVLAAVSYDIRISVSGTGDWTTVSVPAIIPELFYNFLPLLPCTNYTLQIRTICQNGPTDWKEIQFITLGCGQCVEGNYCASTGESQEFEHIAHVSINTLENNSAADGYGNYTQFSTDLVKGNTYEMFLSPGFTQNAYPENFKVWIDYNQDNVFSEPEELAWNAGLSNMSFSGNLTIPGNANTGDTRMRVSMKYIGSFNPPQEPCETIGYGEVEDYCVNLLAPNGCAAPNTIDTIEVTTNTAMIQWQGLGNSTHYSLRYRPFGSSEWQYHYQAQSPVTLTGLSECTHYVFQLQSVCNADSSGYSPGIDFSTDCINAVSEHFSPTDNFYFYPNPCLDNFNMIINTAYNGNIQYSLETLSGVAIKDGTFKVNAGQNTEVSVAFPAGTGSGIYVLYLKTPTGKYAHKILKIK